MTRLQAQAQRRKSILIFGPEGVGKTRLLESFVKTQPFALARTCLVQCALIAKRYGSFLQNFYQRIQRRRGGGKANIALARKFLGVIYHTLKNNWVFEDFPNFVLAS